MQRVVGVEACEPCVWVPPAVSVCLNFAPVTEYAEPFVRIYHNSVRQELYAQPFSACRNHGLQRGLTQSIRCADLVEQTFLAICLVLAPIFAHAGTRDTRDIQSRPIYTIVASQLWFGQAFCKNATYRRRSSFPSGRVLRPMSSIVRHS